MTSPVHEILAVGDQHFQGKIISDGALQTKSGGVIFPDNSVQLTAATGSAISSVFGRTGVVIAASGDYTWGQIDKSTSSLADITTRPHSALTTIGTDDHHAKSHVHLSDGSGTVAHTSLSTVGANDHHNQIHSIGGTDHTGNLALTDITPRAHASLTSLTADDHTQYVLHSILTTRGDIFTRGASTTGRLALGGTAGMFVRSDATDVGWSTLVLPNSATVNRVPYATASNTWGDSANLTFDGTNLVVGGGGPCVKLTAADSQMIIGGSAEPTGGYTVPALQLSSGVCWFADSSTTWQIGANLFFGGSSPTTRYMTTATASGFACTKTGFEFDTYPSGTAGDAATGATTQMVCNVDGLYLGTATGSGQGSGTINVTNAYKNASAYDNPDYILEDYFTGKIVQFANNEGAKNYQGLYTLEQIEALAKQYNTLPLIHEARLRNKDSQGNPRLGIFDGGDAVLASLEQAYIHLWSLNSRIKVLEGQYAR